MKRIVMIDDDDTDTALAIEILGEVAELVIVNDPDEAIMVILGLLTKSKIIDMIVVDAHLPGMMGWEFAGKLKAYCPGIADVPIVLTSVADFYADKGLPFLLKSLDNDKYKNDVRRLLNGT